MIFKGAILRAGSYGPPPVLAGQAREDGGPSIFSHAPRADTFPPVTSYTVNRHRVWPSSSCLCGGFIRDDFRFDHDPTHLYFVTATVCGWKRLFTEYRYAKPVLESLEYIRNHGVMRLFAFVLMPSHRHALVKPRRQEIGHVLQALGSFTAHQLLAEIRNSHRFDLLGFFHEHRRDRRHSHSIWQDIQAKNVISLRFIREKIEYIHNNPIRDGDYHISERADYVYSSACFYDRGDPPVIPIDDIRLIM